MSASHAEIPHLTSDNTTLPKESLWRKFPAIAVLIGLGCLALAFVLGTSEGGGHGVASPAVGGGEHGAHATSHQQFYLSYLTALMFWLAICLGALFFVLIQHGTRAGWSIVVRRVAENWMMVLPLFGVLVIPLFIGQSELYHWTHIAEDDLMLQRKSAYFEGTFYAARTIIVVVVWIALALALYRWSTKQDASGDHRLSHKMRWWAPLGIVGFALTTTVAAIDWMMSLDPHWYSTIFGVYYFAGSVMASGAALTLSSMSLQKAGMLDKAITTEHYHDLGKWSFAFIVFWAYIAFSQFFLIWYANIPEETMWFGHRLDHGWEYLTVFLALAHFVVPFWFMMSRHIKRRRLTLAIGAAWLLFAHYVDIFWLTQPALHTEHFSIHISDLLTLVGMGGIVIGAYVWLTGRSATAPVKDPRIEESLRFENF